MFKNGQILALVDYMKVDQPGLEKAVALAQVSKSKVTALLVVYDRAAEVDTMMAGTPLNNLRQPYLADAVNWLQELITVYQDRGVSIETKVEWNKRPYRTVMECIKVQDYDLIVKSSSHHSLLKRIMYTPDDWHLIREVNTPIYFVKEAVPLQGQKVLLAVDTADEENAHQDLNQQIVTFGKDLESAFQCELNLVNSYPTLRGMASLIPDAANYEAYENSVRENHNNALNQFANENNVALEQTHLRQGAVGLVVQDLVEELIAQLIICGTHSRAGIDGLVVGNSAESILEHTDCSLLVLKDQPESLQFIAV